MRRSAIKFFTMWEITKQFSSIQTDYLCNGRTTHVCMYWCFLCWNVKCVKFLNSSLLCKRNIQIRWSLKLIVALKITLSMSAIRKKTDLYRNTQSFLGYKKKLLLQIK